MQEQQAERLVATLRERNVMAHTYSTGVYAYGIRVVIPDGREAIWDADGAAGLEATIMRDGVLVGMVPTIPGVGVLRRRGGHRRHLRRGLRRRLTRWPSYHMVEEYVAAQRPRRPAAMRLSRQTGE